MKMAHGDSHTGRNTINLVLTAATFPSSPCSADGVWPATDAQRLWASPADVEEGTAMA